jgi:Fe-S oxidoreductase
MRLLERAAMDYARSLEPDSYNMPPKAGRIAIVGAGPSGLACALRLAAKKYAVTVFERSGRIGGHLHGLLAPEVILADIERQFMHEEYELRLDTEVESLGGLGFDAIYVATGAGGSALGLEPDPGGAYASATPGAFLGGSLVGADTMRAIADGLRASLAVERYLKTGGMNQARDRSDTALAIDATRVAPAPAVAPANGAAYTREEAAAEAARCLSCSCDACVRSCDLMDYFKKFPRRISEEVEITIHPGTLDGNGTVATRLISTCNQCGLCKEACPKGIDTGELLRNAHRIMREKGAMPWAYHDFFLRDMESAVGEAALARMPAGRGRSRRAFFPGCQLGASDPRYVIEAYRALLDAMPDTALMLSCCGAPAEWAGDEAIRGGVADRLRADWKALGEPELLFACPTCALEFRRYLPEIPGRFLYDFFLGAAPRRGAESLPEAGAIASVFDPCASREEPGLQRTVRELATRAGLRLEPLPSEGRLAKCCGWGGQVSIAHPPYARRVAMSRIGEGERPYVTYCSNCRDVFAAAGKPAWHILDLVLGLGGPDRKPPTATERRLNRIELKRRALAEFWKEGTEVGGERPRLLVSPELGRKLDAERILETDIEKVIEGCESSGSKLLDPETGAFSGHLKIGNMTYWAEYRPAPPSDALPDGGYELLNAYSHRMSIEES